LRADTYEDLIRPAQQKKQHFLPDFYLKTIQQKPTATVSSWLLPVVIARNIDNTYPLLRNNR